MSDDLAVELMIMSGPDDGTITRLDKPKHGETYLLGRREDNDVILPYDSQISRQHTRLFWMDGAWHVQDLDSRNGTYVGQQKIDCVTRLAPGQMFRMGRTWLRLQPKQRGLVVG